MPERTSELRLVTALDEQKLKLAQSGIAALQKRVGALEASLRDLQKTAKGSLLSVAQDMQKLDTASLSQRNNFLKGTQAIKDQADALERHRRVAAKSPGTGGLGRLGAASSAIGSALSGVGAGGVGQLVSTGGQISRAAAELGQLQTAVGGVGVSAGAAAAAAGIGGIALGAMALAVSKFGEAVEEGHKRVENAISGLRLYYELTSSGTSEEIKQQLELLRAKRENAASVRRDLQAGIEEARKSPVLGMRFGEIDKFTEDIGARLSQTFGGAGQKEGGIWSSLLGLTQQAKAADEQVSALDVEIAAHEQALKSLKVATNDAVASSDAYGEALKKSAEERRQITDQIAQQEIEVLRRAADQRIALAQRTAQQEQDALEKLQQDLREGQIQLDQKQADTRLQYQRDEALSARSHYLNLLKIQKNAEQDSEELILRRDFLGLARLERDKNRRLQEEDDSYLEQRRQRLGALRNQLADQQKAFLREREQRIRQYQQQITDLRQVQVRELQAIDEAARADLQRLNDRLQAELKMRNDANTRALQIEAEFLRIREQLVAGSISAAQAAFQQMQSTGTLFSSIGSQKRMEGLASGGPLRAGRLALVNEGFTGQRESFRAGGKSGLFPNTMGLFMPLKSGSVDPGRRGNVSIPISLTVNGNSYADIRRRVHADLDVQLSAAFEELAS